MNSRFILRDEDIVILGEKATNNDTNNSVDIDNIDARLNSGGEDERASKSLNGGPGSGNFGHSGRPGQVGGSSKSVGVAISDSRTITAKWAREHREQLKRQLGYTDDAVDEMIRTIEGVELKKKAEKASTTDKFDKIIAEMKEKGVYTDTWWEVVGKATRESIAAKMERKEKAVTPEQSKAIDDLLKDTGIMMNPTDEKWLRQNVPVEMVKELHNELNLAFKEGLDNNIRIMFSTARTKLGSCTVEGPNFERVLIRLTKDMMSNTEYNRTISKQKGEKGTKWWTCKEGQIGSTIRHEIGHALVWQVQKNQGRRVYEYDSVNGKIVHDAKKVFAGLKPSDQVYGSNIPAKAAIKLSSLRKNENLKYISKYGRTNSAETIAESYVNPDYSEFTKEVYKQLKKALKG